MRPVWVALLALPAILVAGAPAAAAPNDVPTESGAPWPSMRHDRFNTGRSPIRGRYHAGDRPWALQDGQGRLQHADRGTRRDRLRRLRRHAGSTPSAATGGGAGASRPARSSTRPACSVAAGTVTFGSGDEHIYRLRSRPRRLKRAGRTIWRFRATRPPAEGQLVNWWEGNVTMGPGGVLYAGNTGGAEYALNPNGRRRWVFPTGNSVWSNAAIGATAPSTSARSTSTSTRVDAQRASCKWKRATAGFVTSSPAIGPGGTVYIGSFDGALHALDPSTGRDRWTLRDRRPRLRLARARGGQRLHRLRRRLGLRPRPARATCAGATTPGDTVRSSPVLGPGAARRRRASSTSARPTAELYALDAAPAAGAGPSTPPRATPVLRDRNDLNSSPALGRRGVYIGGEHGRHRVRAL